MNQRLRHWSTVAGKVLAATALIVGGIVLGFLPGPGFVLVLAGLAVLASEFTWAERLLARMAGRVRSALDGTRVADSRVGRWLEDVASRADGGGDDADRKPRTTAGERGADAA